MPTLNINGNIRTNTAAGWGADTTVYTAKTILVTTDATYGATDQREFKIADGTQTWANLDYFPVSGYDDATSSIQTQLNNKLATFNYFNTTSYLTVDGSTVFFGKSAAINTSGTSGFTPCVPLPSGKIVKVIVGVYSSGSLATTELSTLSLLTTTTTRYDTTNLISSSLSFSTGVVRQSFQSFTVDIDVVAGESCIQLELATFATNPSIQLDVTVLMRLS